MGLHRQPAPPALEYWRLQQQGTDAEGRQRAKEAGRCSPVQAGGCLFAERYSKRSDQWQVNA